MSPLVLTALRIEALALGRRLPVRAVGMGARSADLDGEAAVIVAGTCGAIDPALRAGDVVVATELRDLAGRSRSVCAAEPLAEALRGRRLRVATGPLVSAGRILGPAEREGLRGTGAVAVDMESFALAEAAGDRLVGVVRVVADEAGRSLRDPRSWVGGARALRTLRRVAAAIAQQSGG